MVERYRSKRRQTRSPVRASRRQGGGSDSLKAMDRLVRPRRERSRDLDAYLERLLDRVGWNISVSWFLCTSFLYYVHHVSVISDNMFDNLCSGMLKRWRFINHRHKVYITKDMLRAGTGYNLPFKKLPNLVHGGANSMYKKWRDL